MRKRENPQAAAEREALSRVIKDYGECEKHHRVFCERVEKQYRAWRGVPERRAESVTWTSKTHPPYLMHIVETTLASLVDTRPKFRVRPLPRLADPDEIMRLQQGAEAHEILLGWQMLRDRFHEKMRPYVMQGLIAGLTVGKVMWRTEERVKRFRELAVEWDEEVGAPVPRIVERAETRATFDQPCFEVRDIRDFMWNESATSLDTARYVIDRTWSTLDQLRELEKQGIYQNVKGLEESRGFEDEYAHREQELFQTDRTKGMIEVLEHWTDDRVVTIANRKVVLRDVKNPFWHGRKPFVVCSTQPDLFRIPGISQVEKVAHLQELLWSLVNQRIDNLRLINNAIVIISDVDDPDDYVFAPGEKWAMDNPAGVQMWTPNVIPAQVSLGAEALIKGDMQNLAGGFPFSSGTDSQNIDQKTATGATIITNIAQQAIKMSKQIVAYSLERAGQMMVELNAQFVTDTTLAQTVGVDSDVEIREITPLILQGDYLFEITEVDESLMRQERRAEAQAMLQMALTAAPVMAAQSQGGLGHAVNMDEFMREFLHQFGIRDYQRFLASPPATPPPGPTSPQGPPTGGVTAPQSVDAGTSPSNEQSLNPMVMMQRQMAMGGPQGG